MKTIFAFDTATSTATCALVRDGELLGERRSEAKAVLAAADELARAAGIGPAEIDALVVGTGRGASRRSGSGLPPRAASRSRSTFPSPASRRCTRLPAGSR